MVKQSPLNVTTCEHGKLRGQPDVASIPSLLKQLYSCVSQNRGGQHGQKISLPYF